MLHRASTIICVFLFAQPLVAQQRLLPVSTSESAPAISLEELLDTEQDFAATPEFESRLVSQGWWYNMVQSSLRRDASPVNITLDDTLIRALRYSHQIQVFSELPLIRETSITEADAAFDWSVFMDSQWNDSSDPVGNSLTAGPGITRFRDHNLTFSAGARKRTWAGGQLEVSQQAGLQNNNSQFFTPNDQGTSRLVLSFSQPLLRGKGQAYNRSLVCLASIDKQIADFEFRRQLESHLLEVTRAYWAVYLERGVLLQKMNSYRRAKTTVGRLASRATIDASESQIKSAQAALKTRGAELIRARNAMRNAASRLRSLVNDPSMKDFDAIELIPADEPMFQTFCLDIHGALAEAIQNRPEVAQSIRQIKAAGIRTNMTKHELLPVLNLVTETYVAGLNGQHDVGAAWSNQFSDGEPGYSIELQFEVPLQNRAARSRHQRRCLELRQMKNQYATTLETIELEVQVAVREVSTSQRELFAKEEAMLARQEQMDYITERWKRLPGEGVSASLTLENLLTAQERLAAAEYEYLQSQMTYNLSLTNLKRATGTLLQHEAVTVGRTCVNGLPTQMADKPSVAR